MKVNQLGKELKDALLDQTYEALKEFAQVAVNAGMTKGEVAVMFRAIADEYAPPIELPSPHTVQ